MEITPLEQWISDRINAGSDTGAGACPDGSVGRGRFGREQIEAYQLEQLRRTVRWTATRSPFYKRHLAGMTKNDLGALDDLASFPFTTAEDLRRNPLQFLCVSQSEVSRVVTLQTSGTTGDPKRIHFTEEDQQSTLDFFHRGMSTLVGPGDRVLILMPGGRPGSVGDLLVKGLDRLGAVGLLHGPLQDPSRCLDIMAAQRIDVLVGIPVQVLALARHSNWNVSASTATLRSVLLTADYVPEAVVSALHRGWGCEVFTHYGMTEMGFGGGVECRAHFGYHMRELDLYFEIVDPQTGSPMADGERGEIVFTTLTRKGMPLIRYRTGDFSRFLLDRCPCGTVLKSMEKVGGRVDGSVRLALGYELSIADLDEVLFAIDTLLDFEAFVTREGARDRLHIDAYSSGPREETMTAAILDALSAVQGLRVGLDAGDVTLSVRVHSGALAPSRGTCKRAIIDRRSFGSRQEGAPPVTGAGQRRLPGGFRENL